MRIVKQNFSSPDVTTWNFHREKSQTTDGLDAVRTPTSIGRFGPGPTTLPVEKKDRSTFFHFILSRMLRST